MRYEIRTTAGKNLFSEHDTFDNLNDAKNVLNELYLIDQHEGMNPEWTSPVAYQCEVTLPNGLVCLTRTWAERAGKKTTRKNWKWNF